MGKEVRIGKSLDEILAGLEPERREKIETAAALELRQIEGLKALRQIAERSQADIAGALGVTQPSIVKIERQADLYLSTLRRFVEAAGGTLELRVELPGTGPFVLAGIGDGDAARRSPNRIDGDLQ